MKLSVKDLPVKDLLARSLPLFSYRCLPLTLLALLLAACAVNPVTGQRELSFISQSEEVAMGQQNYAPTLQSQGGKYQVDPGLTEYVNRVGQRLAAVSDRQLPYEFTVINNSVPNAWALPGGKIAINRGLLLELNNEAELAAVLGHEIVHSAARHGAQAMERGMLLQGVLVATSVAASNSEYGNLITGGAQLGAQLATQRYGRDAEREADTYGIRYMATAGYDPAAAISLQETFVRLSEGRESSWLDGLFASHPPSIERVNNNRALVAQLRVEGISGGELGEQQFREQIGFLQEMQPAYQAYDEALELLRADRAEAAMDKIDTAIALLPREARFHGLKADIYLYQRRYQAAIAQYDQALERDDAYFDYYLGRGLAYSREGDRTRAQADLQASVDLLPTATAMNELGALAQARNDRQAAKQYFSQAASAQGPIGEQATAAYIRLDIEDQPAQYIETSAYLDNEGRLLARINNRAPIGVSELLIEFTVQLDGRTSSRQRRLSTLAAGQSLVVDSGLSLPATTATALPAAVRVLSLRAR
ncbi:MAG: M48 family metalloprotease [Pseudomonadales bacterium]|nr:M48 family metalloprotease [Pseudomonadales bacterium]